MAGRLPLYKVVVLGDGGVGKTAFTLQMCFNNFVETYDPTIEDSYRKHVLLCGEPCVLEILDTAGQEEYQALRQQWILDGEGFILIYSITSRTSFDRIKHFHDQVGLVKELAKSKTSTVICLVGNKADRITEREVSTQEGFAMAKELACSFFEVSCKDCYNIQEPFDEVLLALRRQRQAISQSPPPPKIIKEATAILQSPAPSPRQSRFRSFTNLFRTSRILDDGPRSLDVTQQMHLNRLLVQTARRDKRKTAKRLLAIGADPNGDVGADGSALYAAATLGNLKMVILLLENNAAINAKSLRGSTPLITAAAEGHATVVEVLLARGALVDARSDISGTATMIAAFRGHSSVLQILLRYGADVNQKGGQYGTVLHTAAVTGNVNVAKIILDAGADVTARDEDDCTPLQVAAAAGHAEVVRLFLLRGAQSIINDTRGKYGSALKAANDKSRFNVMKLLLECGAKEENPYVPLSSDSTVSKVTTAGTVLTPVLHNNEFDIAQLLSASNEPGDPTPRASNSAQAGSGNSNHHQATDMSIVSDSDHPVSMNIGQSKPSSLPSLGPPTLSDDSAKKLLTHLSPRVRETTASSESIALSTSGSRSLFSSPQRHASPLTVRHNEYRDVGQVPWKSIARLGQGQYTSVDEVRSTENSLLKYRYARKVVFTPPRSRKTHLSIIHNEVDILRTLCHQHIVRVHSTYQIGQEFAIVMTPVAEMNLAEYLSSHLRPPLDSPMYTWFGCLATAFTYLHTKKIKHRDVKPTNILINGPQVLIADFGISKACNQDPTGTTGPVDARTLMYCAPEVAAVEEDQRRGRAADMFSLGCVFLEMTTALLWRHGCSVQQLHGRIVCEERRVYSRSLDELLRWILMLHAFVNEESTMPGATPSRASKTAHERALQWCLSMLLPDADDRVSAPQLRNWMLRAQSWMGECCAPAHAEDECLEDSDVGCSWPGLTLDDLLLEHASLEWKHVKSWLNLQCRVGPT